MEDFLRRHAVLLAAIWLLAGGMTAWFVYARWSHGRAVAGRGLATPPLTMVGAPEPTTRERMQVDCDRGNAVSCREMGTEAQRGARGAPPDLAQSRASYEKACDLGDGWSCLTAGLMHERAQGTPRDFAQAAAFFAKSCDVRYPAGCQYLGDEYAHGEGVPRDAARGRALYTEAAGLHAQACDAGEAYSCHALGTMYGIGQGVPVDPRRARALTEQACRGGLREACP